MREFTNRHQPSFQICALLHGQAASLRWSLFFAYLASFGFNFSWSPCHAVSLRLWLSLPGPPRNLMYDGRVSLLSAKSAKSAVKFCRSPSLPFCDLCVLLRPYLNGCASPDVVLSLQQFRCFRPLDFGFSPGPSASFAPLSCSGSSITPFELSYQCLSVFIRG